MEYWIYLPGDKLPKQDAIMDRMLKANPHPGMPIGPNEAILFSDIRLHIALVSRSRNPHVFRPDLFAEDIDPTAEILSRLAESQSFAKVRFISEDALADKKHIQFLAHAADAISALAGGLVIYDTVAEHIMLAEDFRELLTKNRDATGPELQTRILWRRRGEGGHAETRGLAKIGLHEIVTEDMDADQQVLVKEVLGEVVESLWTGEKIPEKVDVAVFDDQYHVEVKDSRKGPAKATIMKGSAIG
jgi:hypothetical protein